MKMDADLARRCIEVIEQYSHIALTEAQFEELMNENPDLEDGLIEFDSPSDTADREWMIERLAIKIVGRPWPCNGDGREAMKKFYADLLLSGHEQGYKFTGD